MEYKINKGDCFLCIKDFIMDDGGRAYTKGVYYKSNVTNCITDNQYDPYHNMLHQKDFSKHFKIKK